MSVPPPCPHCGSLQRTWYAMDSHLKFACPVLRPETVEVLHAVQ